MVLNGQARIRLYALAGVTDANKRIVIRVDQQFGGHGHDKGKVDTFTVSVLVPRKEGEHYRYGSMMYCWYVDHGISIVNMAGASLYHDFDPEVLENMTAANLLMHAFQVHPNEIE